MQPTAGNPGQKKRAQTKVASSCTHGRVVDEVRSADGPATGLLICKECLAKFPDSRYEKLTHSGQPDFTTHRILAPPASQ
jgi:hypothetical protein